MKKVLLIIFTSLILVTSYAQIIADHNAVAAFDDIPQAWLNEVMKMQLGYVGESHSAGIREGLLNLESANNTYQAEVSWRPAASGSNYLRAFAEFYYNGSWGPLGEYEWYKNSNAVESIIAGITYINETLGNSMDVFGLGWCWDPAETATEMPSYVSATKAYIKYCKDQGYNTKVIFTTGPVDDQNASGQTGWNKHLAYEVIRDSVANDESRVLFDFADILCYDDGSDTPNTTTWNGNTYPIITNTNLGDGSIAHMSSAGVLRLAKAMWWMLARIAGWDGGVATGNEEISAQVNPVIVSVIGSELRVEMKDPSNLPGRISLHNLQGSTVSQKDNPGSVCSFSTAGMPAGIYLVVISGAGINKTQKVFIQ